ncbi:MAG: hypothetical protein JNK72_18470 [Myxococcales bacterium]|nr:hypothetical protein [Myxococcales bacterium]
MQNREHLRAMLGALADVKVEGDRFTMGENWDVTLHAGRPGSGLSVQQVTTIELREGFALVETSKGHRYVIVDTDLHAIGQEPSKGERTGRKAGFF